MATPRARSGGRFQRVDQGVGCPCRDRSPGRSHCARKAREWSRSSNSFSFGASQGCICARARRGTGVGRAEHVAMGVDRAGGGDEARLLRIGMKRQVVGIHVEVSSCWSIAVNTTPSNSLRAVRRMAALVDRAVLASRVGDDGGLADRDVRSAGPWIAPSGMRARPCRGRRTFDEAGRGDADGAQHADRGVAAVRDEGPGRDGAALQPAG